MPPMNVASFARCFDAYSASLALYARQWLDAASAEDVVQEVFMRLFRQTEVPANAKAWLFSCVRNAAINHALSRHRTQKREQRFAAAHCEWFQSRTEDLMDAATAQAALYALPLEQREVVVLRLWGAMNLREIAELLEQPLTTVSSRYQTALTGIRRIMESPCKKNQT